MAKPKKKEEEVEVQEKEVSVLRKLTVLFLFLLITVIGYDWYANQWRFIKGIFYANVLELHSIQGSAWTLHEPQDFVAESVEDSTDGFLYNTIARIDSVYEKRGLYRIYFRLSDGKSERLQNIYKNLAVIDTAGSVKQTVEDVQRAYHNLRSLLQRDTSRRQDSLTVYSPDSVGRLSLTQIGAGSDNDLFRGLVRGIGRNPQVLIGLSVGIAASAGLDVLGGDLFVAYAPEDRFGIDSLKIGARVAVWEGQPIDIVWVFGKTPPSLENDLLPVDSLRTE
jgi:hypothetical protein